MALLFLMQECTGKRGQKTLESMSRVVKLILLKVGHSSKAACALAGRAADVACAAMQIDTTEATSSGLLVEGIAVTH